MAFVIQHLSLSPTSYYGGPNSGWVTNKSNAVQYATAPLAQAVIDAYHMYATTTTAGTVTTVTFNASGTFNVPAGVTSITRVQAWGSGGGSGGASANAVNKGSGGGGGGGAYAESTGIVVTPLEAVAITIGAAGSAGVGGDGTDTDGGVGGSSIFDAASEDVIAVGGLGGLKGSGSRLGGDGGSAGACTGDILQSGGNGGTGVAGPNKTSGGGGAGAGIGNFGVAACGAIGGFGTDGGGSGANGTLGDGTVGTAPGGGSSGGGVSTPPTKNGAVGAVGKVIVTYTAP